MTSVQQTPINAATQLYGVFGHPVGHSLSPMIHNAAFRHIKANAVYLAFDVDKNHLGLAFESLRAMGVRGVNVTIPHKEEAVNFVDEIPEDVDRAIGAINTVVNREGQLYGYNTDSPGFLEALHGELNFNPQAKTILLLGAGGAARGILFSLARAHAEKIWIYNRSAERAHGLADYSASFFPETELEVAQMLHQIRGEKIDLVVNATSCGMQGNHDSPLDLRILEQKTTVYDLVYSSKPTPFLQRAQELGFAHANGLGMLVNQAALSFELWTGKREGVREAMRAELAGQGL